MAFSKSSWGSVGVSLAIATLGLYAVVVGSGYRMGELTRMGPGFFPVIIGTAVIVLALAAAFESRGENEERMALRLAPIVWVGTAILAWLLLVQSLGLVVATFALVGLSALAKPPIRPVSILVLGGALSLSGYLVFIWGLGMPLTLWGR
ncbi:tripartite tricarboxylate transporter TctB family protein [Devosia sp.]|uniref:tripartite tricarboxylate transporter TctB family protein n=1 Tax=Devosia sp. TaxID=1871048 RepID=UPI0027344FB5|nr:tripartite tricarboxylate transporter TctB family protein [Devosia sp.]MDP2779618.1 tripartite tricarboxylate transporter TctB family protein [Devosia sp.]